MVGDISTIYQTIKERINAITPGAYSTDFYTHKDFAKYEGENASIPLYFRNYDVKTTSETENEFSGNYAYQSKTISLLVNIYYSQMGATRILGDDTIDFNAFALNDVEDIQGALITPFNLDTGSTARLIRRGAQIDTVDSIIVVSISYDLVCFLVGSQQLPALYLGPDIKTTQDAGDTQYIVALSDKNCNATLAANKAGLTFDASFTLIAGQPQIIAIEGDTVDAWTLTLTALGQTATCNYQIFAGNDFTLVGPDIAIPNDVWTYNLAVAAASDGVLDVSGSANLTLPENVTIVNNKGVIPVTIVTRGSHSVTVGDDTCNFTSATPATKIPKFDPYWAYDIYGAEGTNTSYWPLSGCIDPRVENYACINTLGDNTRRFTLAVRIKTSRFSSSAPIMGIAPAGSYTSANLMLHTVGPVNLSFYYHNVSNVLRSVPTNTALVNDSNFYSYVFNVYFDRNTNTGYIESWRDGVYTSQTALNIDYEPGYNPAIWFHKFLICPTVATIEVRDIYISNICNWTQSEVDAYHGETTVDPNKYTLHWTCEKNTDLPYHVEYDSKNNMPLAFNMQTNYLTWVPKP